MSGTPWETVTLTTLSRDRKLFPQLLGEARDLAMRGQEGKLVIHTAWGTEWRPFGQPRLKRPLQSVVLAPGLAENIEHDIKSFLERRQWYADRGLYFQPSVIFFICSSKFQEYLIVVDICYTDRLDQGKRLLFRHWPDPFPTTSVF